MDEKLNIFIRAILSTERAFRDKLESEDQTDIDDAIYAFGYLQATIESGSPITLGLNADPWFYVPFNFQNESRRAVFEDALATAGIDIKDLHSLEAILKLKPEIIKAYKAVESDLNLTSLVVY